MNYGEEYVFWYLRLNGFFPITNFVIHKSSHVSFSSDCDVLAIRMPFVYEEIGGLPDDWDDYLRNILDFDVINGIICEVKTGDYDPEKLFIRTNLSYSIGRLGFISRDDESYLDNILDVLDNSPQIFMTADRQNIPFCITKLLVANSNKGENSSYSFLPFDRVLSFLRDRIKNYRLQKYRDRMFFGSNQFQAFIDYIALDRFSGEEAE